MNMIGALKAAMLPIAAIVILQIISQLVGLVPIIGMVALCSCIIIIPVHGWVGYAIQKKGFTMGDSAVVGAIAGIISGIIQIIMSFVAQLLAGVLGVTLMGNSAGDAVLSGVVGAGVTGIVGLVCMIPIYAVLAAILAVIGYFIAQQMKK